MSDEDDNAAGDPEGAFLDNSRRSRAQRVLDFIHAAGLQLNDVTSVLRRAPITLDDAVTDEHRELVIDLKASGCPDEDVARFFRISKERCQRLFDWELSNGMRLRTVQHVRALNVNATQLGDTSAILGYLKMQPDLQWGSKHTQKVVDEPPPPEGEKERLAQNEAFIAGITAGLQIDVTKHRPPKERVKAAPVAAEPKKVGYTGTVRKAKGD
jgi:hypothetical protein